MTFPKQITFPSDSNEAEFKEIITHDGRNKLSAPRACYVYTKSKTKIGWIISFSEDEFNVSVARKIILPITQ